MEQVTKEEALAVLRSVLGKPYNRFDFNRAWTKCGRPEHMTPRDFAVAQLGAFGILPGGSDWTIDACIRHLENLS
jgi:hypothetical protein